jgi:epsilon-lactone hydrolase
MNLAYFVFRQFLKRGKRLDLKRQRDNIPIDPKAARMGHLRANTFFSRFIKLRSDVILKEVYLDRIFAYHAKPMDETKRVILYFHGGAYMTGLKDVFTTYKYYSAELAHLAKAEVYVIDYRVAPEDPFPSALEDAYAAYTALLTKGISEADIFLGGDSSGGGLAIALLMKIRDENKPLPRAAIANSPWTDMTCSGESMLSRLHLDPWLSPTGIAEVAALYLNGHDPKDPYASPLFGDFRGLPPMMLIVGGREVLFDDSFRVYEKATKAGVDIILDVNEEMIHVYPLLGTILKESRDATQRIADFIIALSMKP